MTYNKYYKVTCVISIMTKNHHLAVYFSDEELTRLKAFQKDSNSAFIKQLTLEGLAHREKELERKLNENKELVETLLKSLPPAQAAASLSEKFGVKVPAFMLNKFTSIEQVEKRSLSDYPKFMVKG